VGTPKQQLQNTAQAQIQTQGRELGLLPSPELDVQASGRSLSRTGSPKTVGFDESVVQDQALEDVEESVEHEQEIPELEFHPFFTLISDGVTAEHYHPTVHYVFSDDEEGEELVSEGVVRALSGIGVDEEGNVVKQKQKQGDKQREHVLILDVDVKNAVPRESRGFEVVQAQSLSAEWQVSNVEITSAPTMSQGEGDEDGDGGLMLRIEGRGLLGDETGVEIGREGLESLLGRYERGLVEIRRMAGVKMGEAA
jgi:hypothetical protein